MRSASVWDRARPVDVEGSTALAMSPTDQVFMLSVHLHRHGFNRMLWFKDIDLIIRRYADEIDWEDVIMSAKGEGAEPSLWYTFHFLRRMLGTPVPNEVIEALRPNRFIRGVMHVIWPEEQVMNLQSHTKRRAVQFKVSESLRGMLPTESVAHHSATH